MLNFIKSEYYRMIHTTGIRVFFGILSVLTILLISGISIVETQYHTTSFSYSILVSSPMFFTLMGMLTASIFRNRRAVRAEPDLVLRLPDHLQKRSAESFLFLPKSQTEITLFSSHLLWHYLLVSFKTFIPDFPFVNTYPRSHPIMYV